MKKLSKNQMVKAKGGLLPGNRTVTSYNRFDGYAGNPCKYGRFIQKKFSDGSFETYNILGELVEACYM